jgi:riboflavin synthase
MAETLDRSSLGGLAVGDRVNLERAMSAASRFGGHIVQGHVDGTAEIVSRTPGDRWEVVRLTLPDPLSRYVVEKGSITVDVMAETLDRSSLGSLTVGDRVNLERAMAASSRFGGHIVQGHVDGTAEIVKRTPGDRWEVVELSLPMGLSRYVVEKGSITVDGVSLTVSALTDSTFSVSLIPTTLALTTLGHKGVGDLVNLEVDVLAKYVERLITTKETIA